jgi:4-amino-4-deoxy-L-arabinose transferase-like glycosyltransferase
MAKLVNIALYTAVIVLTYWISKRLFNSEPAARIAMFLLCFYPNQIAYTSLLSTEILFLFLFLVGAGAFMHGRGRVAWLAVAGAAWGLAVLTKPQGIFVPVVFSLVFFTDTKSFYKALVVLYGMAALIVLPWLVRNYKLFGKPLLSTNGGIVLMIGNNPYATGGQIWDDRVSSLLGRLAADEGHLFDGNEVGREKTATAVALSYIVHHPMRTVSRWPRKLAALYASDSEGVYYSLGMMSVPSDPHHVSVWITRAIAQAYYALIMVLCAASLRTEIKSRAKHYPLGFVLIAVFTAIYLVYFGNPRYHFALMPWFALYSGIGGWTLLFNATRTSGEGDIIGATIVEVRN